MIRRGLLAMYKILIVEDDRVIAQALASHLGKWNYETKCVDDFKNIEIGRASCRERV